MDDEFDLDRTRRALPPEPDPAPRSPYNAETDLVPGLILNQVLGRGASAVVYRGRQRLLERDVAVKVLHVDLSSPIDARRFESECRTLGRLSGHPAIVDVLDAGVTPNGQGFVVMPYYRNGTLADRISAGRIDVEEVLSIGSRLCSALGYSHRNGVIHRDIKPENVLLDEDGAAYLSDFGVAAVDDGAGHRTRSIAFTRDHVAPEVLRDNEYGPASDIYSLGSTLFTALSGKPPFNGRTEMLQLHAATTQPFPADRLAGQPRLLIEILRKALAPESVDRFGSVDEMGRAFEAVAAGPVSALPTAPDLLSEPPPAWGTRPPAVQSGPGGQEGFLPPGWAPGSAPGSSGLPTGMSGARPTGARPTGARPTGAGPAGSFPTGHESVDRDPVDLDPPTLRGQVPGRSPATPFAAPDTGPAHGSGQGRPFGQPPFRQPAPAALPFVPNTAAPGTDATAFGSGRLPVQDRPARHRPRWIPAVAGGIAVLVIVVGGAVAWGRTQFSVTERNGEVVILNGPPGAPLGLSLAGVERTGLRLTDLRTSDQVLVRSEPKVSGANEAHTMIDAMRERADQCRRTVLITACPNPPMRVPKLTAAALTYPKGNQITLTWSDVDHRAGTSTNLTVNGTAPPSGCPAVLTAAGSCAFTGTWKKTYQAQVDVSGTNAPSENPRTASATAGVQPTLTVFTGAKFTTNKLTYCEIMVTAVGFAPSTQYTATFTSDGDQRRKKAPTAFTFSTDANGTKTVDVGYGVSDPDKTDWVSVTLNGVTGRRDPWACA